MNVLKQLTFTFQRTIPTLLAYVGVRVRRGIVKASHENISEWC